MSGHVVLSDPHNRVLVLRGRSDGKWQLPGGLMDSGESVRQAALREFHEEVGVPLLPEPRLEVKMDGKWIPASKWQAELWRRRYNTSERRIKITSWHAQGVPGAFEVESGTDKRVWRPIREGYPAPTFGNTIRYTGTSGSVVHFTTDTPLAYSMQNLTGKAPGKNGHYALSKHAKRSSGVSEHSAMGIAVVSRSGAVELVGDDRAVFRRGTPVGILKAFKTRTTSRRASSSRRSRPFASRARVSYSRAQRSKTRGRRYSTGAARRPRGSTARR